MRAALLRRKTAVVVPWEGIIGRERLQARLSAAVRDGKHVAVIAGPGYGKTALLASWCQSAGGSANAAWLTLDAEDADLDTFLAYLIRAIEAAFPDFRTEASGLVDRARDREGALAAITALLADLDEQADSLVGPAGQRAVLVLDDYHLAATPSLDAVVARLLTYLPPEIRTVLVSRETPDIGLAARQARQEMLVLGEPDLAFDLVELGSLSPAEPKGQLTALLERTGGWPAAVALPSGSIDAYLAEQMLRDVESADRTFLAKAAQVEAFDPGLCEDALDQPLDRDLLERLLKRRLILTAGEGTFEVPRPLRDVLRRNFAMEVPRPARVALSSRIADAAWDRGQPLTAITTWVEAGNAGRAADRLAKVADSWLQEGRLDALTRALAAIGTEALRPDLLLADGEVARRHGEFDRAEHCFTRALSAFESAGDAFGAAIAQLRSAQTCASRGRVAQARGLLAACRAPLGGDDRLKADILNVDGGLALLEGGAREAAESFEASLRLARRLSDPYAAARAAHNLGVCHTRLGDFREALKAYDLALEPVQPGRPPAVMMTPINRALVLVYLGDVDRARDAAEQALDLVRRFKLAREEGYALRTLGFALARSGSPGRGAACYDEAERLARLADDTLGLAYTRNFQASLAAEVGQPDDALRLSDEAVSLAGGEEALSRGHEFTHVRAKALLAAGRTSEAAQLVAGLQDLARRFGYKHLQGEADLLAGAIARPSEGRIAPSEGRIAPAEGAAEPAKGGVRPEESGALPAGELDITLFGGMRVVRDGRELADRDWQSSRSKLLLAFLLLHPEGATKGRLLEALYGSEATTDASLHMNMMRLRKALEPALEKGQPSRFILRSEVRYSFNRQAHAAVDAWEFEASCRPGSHGRDAVGEAALRAALALYSGDFLPEFDNDWVVAIRQRYRDLALQACRSLLAMIGDRSEAEAQALAHRALEIDPLSEEFHRELILRFIEAGEPHRALEQFRLCERRYLDLLGMRPPEDLQELVAGLAHR
jgi:ATP/maltotriose-dependent transcriptional regulator MalT/DNA-binding SARP family transcriptional activator